MSVLVSLVWLRCTWVFIDYSKIHGSLNAHMKINLCTSPFALFHQVSTKKLQKLTLRKVRLYKNRWIGWIVWLNFEEWRFCVKLHLCFGKIDIFLIYFIMSNSLEHSQVKWRKKEKHCALILWQYRVQPYIQTKRNGVLIK